MSIFSGGGSIFAFKVMVEYIFGCLKLFLFGMPKYTENSVDGKIVIVTGANCGIGKATAFEMAKRGATVVMACRNLTESQKALDDIKIQPLVTGKLELLHLDLGDLSSVRKFAQTVIKKYKKVHILVANAGLSDSLGKLSKTKDGFEPHMGVNHLGHFLLVNLLLDVLQNGSPSRVVVVSSTMQLFSNLDLNDLMLEKAGIGKGYSNSKYANSLFAKELGKKLAGTGVTTYSMCPGIVHTAITRNSYWARRKFWEFATFWFGFSPSQGCQTVVYCALSQEIENETGKFYRFGKTLESVNQIQTDEMAENLWKLSEQLVGLKKHL